MTIFKKPGSVSGLRLDELKGSLLIIYPKRVDEVKTRLGDKTATRGDVHVVNGPRAGKVFRDTLIFPTVLQDQLRGEIGSGDPVLGRLGLGAAKGNQNAPWVLDDATDDDEQLAAEYLGSGAIGVGELGENGDSGDVPLSDDDGPGW
jgi:hypothetical protein